MAGHGRVTQQAHEGIDSHSGVVVLTAGAQRRGRQYIACQILPCSCAGSCMPPMQDLLNRGCIDDAKVTLLGEADEARRSMFELVLQDMQRLLLISEQQNAARMT